MSSKISHCPASLFSKFKVQNQTISLDKDLVLVAFGKSSDERIERAKDFLCGLISKNGIKSCKINYGNSSLDKLDEAFAKWMSKQLNRDEEFKTFLYNKLDVVSFRVTAEQTTFHVCQE